MQVVQPDQAVTGLLLVLGMEFAGRKMFLEFFPQLLQFLLSQLIDWLQCLRDHFDLHLYTYCFGCFLDAFGFAVVGNHPYLSFTLELGEEVDELKCFVFGFELVIEFLKELLFGWRSTDHGLVIVFQQFVDALTRILRTVFSVFEVTLKIE